jgi:dCMP deaminase
MKPQWKRAHMQVAQVYAENSYCVRRKVGCIIVKNDSVISIGINGTPPGDENVCEIDGVTKPTVLHAEANALTKLAKSTQSSEGASAFITLAPCLDCAKMLFGSGIVHVYYREDYRDRAGIDFLVERGVSVEQITTN